MSASEHELNKRIQAVIEATRAASRPDEEVLVIVSAPAYSANKAARAPIKVRFVGEVNVVTVPPREKTSSCCLIM